MQAQEENSRTAPTDPSRVNGWLEVEEWSPEMAAFIFLNLDPYFTEAPHQGQGWSCEWLCRDRELLSEDEVGMQLVDKQGRFSRDRNLLSKFSRMKSLTACADRLRVRTPARWMEWGRENDLLPGWLAKLSGIETQTQPVEVESETTSPKNMREFSSAGGVARHKQAPVGRAKEIFLPLIDRWLEEVTDQSGRDFAEQLRDEYREHPDVKAGMMALPAHETVTRWIGERRKLRTSQSASAG